VVSDLSHRFKAAVADRYTIERELGRGGMAIVYVAEDLKHQRKVALKVLRPELAASLGAERFLREIRTAAQLTHPNILPLHDSGEADGTLYYTMPYLDGESLRDRLTREKQLPIEEALQITREIADALGYAHEQGIIHRDIKPENILFEAGHAVVSDFGIARAVSAAGAEPLTETGLAVGTPAYMSPEQGVGSGELDGRSDLYSLGCVLYEMLTGETPYLGNTPQAIIAKKLSEPTPHVSVVRDTVPPGVETALRRMLAKNPVDRFATAGRFMEALRTEAGDETAARSTAKRRSARRRALLAVAGVLAVVVTILLGRRSDDAGFPRTEIAVLPFADLSASGSYAYLAAALHGELVTQLATVSELKPRGRVSVMGYAGTQIPLAQVAQELGVGSVVDATVQVAGGRLRVNVGLVDAETEEHLWVHRYDEALDDVLAVQNDIARQVVAAVGAVLTETETSALAAVPTQNAEAYRLYLQAGEYYRRPGKNRRNYTVAQDLFERAVVLDSTFALAHAALSEVHGWMSWHRYDPSPERLRRQRDAAETALRLAPDLPQAHVAMGLAHYHGPRDWQAALDEFRIALERLPNDAELWLWIGYAHRRLGNWNDVFDALDTVMALDPRNVDALSDLGGHSFTALGRYQEAVEWYTRSLELAPDVAGKDVFRGWTWVKWRGSLDSLVAALDRHDPDANVGSSGTVRAWRALALFWERKPDSLVALLHETPHPVFEGKEFYLPTALYAGWALQLKGDTMAARAAFDSARVLLDSVVRELPDDWRIHAARGLAYAGLGRPQEALKEARWLQQPPFYEDPMDGMAAIEERALILLQCGEFDRALDELRRLLARPAFLFSVETLRLDPLVDRLRADPRFQSLLEEDGN
jgi:serine/threonine-protein kinase